MKHYQHILVATNLGEESDTVVEKAHSMAQKSGAKLSIMHVIDTSPLIYSGGEIVVPLNGDIESSIFTQAKKRLAEQSEKYGIETDQQWLQTGNTAEGIVDMVKSQNIDLLLVGNHEHHGLGILLGSTSNSIVHAMPCDVLAVHIN